MPWVARAPRRWPPPPCPRLRVVKAIPPNPYATGYTDAELQQEQAMLEAALGNPHLQPHMQTIFQTQLAHVQQILAAKFPPAPVTPPPLDSVQQWEKLVTLAEAAAPKMQQALTDAFDWPKLPSGVQQSLVQGQVAQALAQMADFGMQQMEALYVPAFSELAEKLFTDVAAAQWPALRETLLQTEIPVELPTKLPDDIMVQRALRYVRQEGLTRAKNLWAPTIEASREIIRVGLAEGKTTPQIARELRQHIGLLPGQGTQLMAYNNGLIESGTPQATIDTLTEKFAAKLLRRRTTVVARTETIAALNVAADTFFEAAKDAANLPETALRRFWLITFDSRTCPICRAIPPQNENGHLFNEPFMTPKGPLLRPPAHPQCRCVVIVRPTIIATPGLAPPPLAPAPTVLPPPVPFPPPLPTPPPKVKKPAKPKKPKAPPAPSPPAMSEQYTIATPSPPWATNPPMKFWEKVQDVDVGPVPASPAGKLSTGVVMIEDGKVWVYEPKNHFGGYSTAFPKGTVEPHLTHQQNALKEVFEETGLHAKVTGFLGDFQATTGTTRLYLGQKIGGNPTGFGGETWSVTLMTPADLEKALLAQNPTYPLQALQALKDKGLIPPTPGVAPPAPTTVLPPLTPPPPLPTVTPTPPMVPPTTAPQVPKAPVKAKPVRATDLIGETKARGEFLEKMGGSTGAERWRGTDGVERVIKKPATGQAYEEFLANKLYKELGVDTPDQQLVMEGGKIVGVASPFLHNSDTLERVGVTKARAQEVLKGFVADVWLANRDAVGLTSDNIRVQGSRLVRIDNGGALHYRAQGTLKPKEWLGTLDEWQGLQNPAKNRAYAALFTESGYGTPEGIPDLKAQVQKLVDLRERTNGFADLVPAVKGMTAKQRKDVVQLLQKRASLLEEQVGLKAPRGSDPVVAKAQLQALMGSTYDDYAQRSARMTSPPAAMHEHERVALWAYTGESSRFSYHTMNPPFWTSNDPAFRAQERQRLAPLIDAAAEGLTKLEQSQSGQTYYRGVREITPEQLAQIYVGNIITLEGFASTSLSERTADNFGRGRYLFKIKNKGGSYDVRPVSQFGNGEGEFLYPPDTQFRVDQVGVRPSGRPIYYLTEIPAVQKRDTVGKAAVDAKEADTTPGWEGWSAEQVAADAAMTEAGIAAYTPTTEELAMGERFMRKQESAHVGPAKPPETP